MRLYITVDMDFVRFWLHRYRTWNGYMIPMIAGSIAAMLIL